MTKKALVCGAGGFIGSHLWVIFIVGTANFYNFMDGINGIGGITGIIAFAFLAFFAYSKGMVNPFIILPICISLSCLGFLPFNIVKAKVFMGDVGSYFLGFSFASLIYLFSRDLLDFLVLASFLFPFYADELTTMAIRIKDGENLTKPHRRHLYQSLADEGGIAHWKIAMGYGIFQVTLGMISLSIKPYGVPALIAFLISCFLGFVLVSFRVHRQHGNYSEGALAKGNP